MFEVNIYLETSLKGPGTRKGWYAAVVEYIDRRRHAQTREEFVQEEETTYHKSTLCALIKALKRLNTSCDLKIYTDSSYLQNNVENNVDKWKKNGFVNVKGEAIKNQEEWKELVQLISGHKIEFRITKRHLYTVWMRNEAEKRLKNVGDSVNTECEGV